MSFVLLLQANVATRHDIMIPISQANVATQHNIYKFFLRAVCAFRGAFTSVPVARRVGGGDHTSVRCKHLPIFLSPQHNALVVAQHERTLNEVGESRILVLAKHGLQQREDALGGSRGR